MSWCTVLLMFFFLYLPAVRGLVFLLTLLGKKAGTLKVGSISPMTRRDELADLVQVHGVRSEGPGVSQQKYSKKGVERKRQ